MNRDDWSDRDLVEELCAIEEGLTEWEVTFIEGVAASVSKGFRLSQKQRAIAIRILGKVEGYD